MQPSFRRLAWCALLAGALAAQTRLHLKTGSLAESREPEAIRRRIEPQLRRSFNRIHVLVQFDGPVSAEQIAELENRGARFVQYVPDTGYLFSVWSGQSWETTGLRVSRFEAAQKISVSLAAAEERVEPSGEALVEFYPDVDPEAAKAISEQAGFEILEHPDVLPHHVLVRGRPDRFRDLAEWDEVAYVFPASRELLEGERVEACPGAITALGTVGQYVARVGEGWDGPGKGRADLGYFFQRLTQKLPPDQIRSEALRAMGEWSRVAGLTFHPAAAPDLARTLNLLFGSGYHGDAYPFDGPGRVLAHTFYPAPPNPEPIAGDLHLDEDEEWVTGPDLGVRSVDLYSVTLHELGHALGLGHSDVPGSVMYPYYRRQTVLTAEDIRAIQELYAPPPQGGDPEPGAPTGGQPPQPPPEPEPAPAVSITSPTSGATYNTASSSVTLTGTATPASGIARVEWANARGGAGLASGAAQWTAGPIPLQLGPNVLTVTAYSASGANASRSLTVSYSAAPDALAPAIKITSPSSTSVLTSAATIRVAGTATDNVGVTAVTWSTSTGKSGTAAGAASWTADVPLLVGTNTIVVRAYDAAGNSSWRSLTVTRR